MKKYKWLMKKDLYEEHLKTFNCFLENKLIHTHNSYEYIVEYNKYLEDELERLNNIINRTTKYVQSLSSEGRGCDIYEDIKQEILKELKGSDKE